MNNINDILKAIENNNMQGFFVQTKEEALKLTESLLEENSTVTIGGSVTLSECKITDLLKSGKYNFLDRSAEGLTPDNIRDIYTKAFSADTYLGSCNAITQNGTIYNVDGNGNRISAMIFGPKQVIIVAGVNKIVKDGKEAVLRIKTVSAPKNAKRLNCDTYCAKTGKCVSLLKENPEITDGCDSAQRICRDYVFLGKQKEKNRIKVILVNETLGY